MTNVRIEALLSFVPPRLEIQEIERCIDERFGLRGRWRSLKGERDQNWRLAADDGTEYVVKVAAATEDPAVLDFQCKALQHIASVDPDIPVPRVRLSVRGALVEPLELHDGQTHGVRVLTYLAGRQVLERLPLNAGAFSLAELSSLGRIHGRIAGALRGFHHTAAEHPLAWDLKNGLVLSPELRAPGLPGWEDIVAPILERFRSYVLPALKSLRGQVIHNDIHEANLLTTGRGALEISGVIDFGDMVFGSLAQDLSVPIASFNAWGSDLLGATGAIVAGYHGSIALLPEEIELIHELVMVRTILNILLTDYQLQGCEDPPHELLAMRQQYVTTLPRLAALDCSEVIRRLRAACYGASEKPHFRDTAGRRIQPDAGLLERRSAALGETFLFYESPIQIVRGRGAYLYDAEGVEYLDAYNNVPQVGHSHPRVLTALTQQASLLNVHNRYLHESIVLLAERLERSLPHDLDVCMFTCTGSEANDLALRIARAVTGNAGVIAIEHAYHGSTTVAGEFSPLEPRSGGTPSWVALLPAPNTYRGIHRSGEEALGEKYSQYVDGAALQLAQAGHQPAALFVDSIFDSNGVLLPPRDYLAKLFANARAHGALCVADEVQSGFARCGGALWGFVDFDVIPDIVTMGKSMGNGYPVAAVVTTREIARRFSEHNAYFSTCAGTPVAAAVGLAVLDVIEHEGLAEHAMRVGAHLMEGLQRLKAQFPVIGHVHGRGMFLGVDLISDPRGLQPAAASAKAVVERMRERHVLIGRSGPLRNVLKIRPPLVFSGSDAQRLLEALESSLGCIGEIKS